MAIPGRRSQEPLPGSGIPTDGCSMVVKSTVACEGAQGSGIIGSAGSINQPWYHMDTIHDTMIWLQQTVIYQLSFLHIVSVLGGEEGYTARVQAIFRHIY